MYRPSALFRRTAAERRDQLLSWRREDTAFFAAGACHILAFAFLEAHPAAAAAGFGPVGLWARGARDPSHVFVSDGAWAFDHDGWTPTSELLAVTRAAEPEAGYTTRPIVLDLDAFCAGHWHRPRHLFAHDPWPRALRYVARLPGPPGRP
ncbi:hypothetical protein [Streptomyces sp. B6B3]|uniref:hypothetical protein n=1 Tax=Streptomyces sp. B6B3 TaxID=3153570 RepID=UPI00325E93B5